MPTWDIDFALHIDLGNIDLIRLLAEAHALAKVIRGFPITPSQRQRINKLNIIRAIRGTTAIEGNSLPEEAVERLIRTDAHAVTKEEQEVVNAYAAQEFITRVLAEDPGQPLSDHLVREIHKLISSGIPYDKNEPGAYRNHAVAAADYVPPRAGEEVRSQMRRFFQWLNEGDGRALDPILRAVAAHFYFISIHPFGDGNGRTARAIESYLLYTGKLNTLGFYSLANYYYRNRTEYISALDDVRFRARALTPFLLFCLRGFVEELNIVHLEVIKESRRIAYRDYAREILLKSKTGERMLKLVLGLSVSPEGVDFADLLAGEHRLFAPYAKKTAKTLRRDLDFLQKNLLITVESGKLSANLGLMDQFSGEGPREP